MQSSLENQFWPSAIAATSPAYQLSTTRVSAIMALAVASDYLFWQEGGGVNWLVYMVLLVLGHLLLLPRHAPVRRTVGFWVAMLGCLASGGAVAWYGSGAAVLAAVGSGLLLVGLVNQPHIQLVSSALGTAVLGVGPGLRALLGSVRAPRQVGARLRRGWFYGRLLGVPLLALGVFQALFALANPRYADLSGRVWAWLGEGLARLLAAVSVSHLLFLVGCGVVAAALAPGAVLDRLLQDAVLHSGQVRDGPHGLHSAGMRTT